MQTEKNTYRKLVECCYVELKQSGAATNNYLYHNIISQEKVKFMSSNSLSYPTNIQLLAQKIKKRSKC